MVLNINLPFMCRCATHSPTNMKLFIFYDVYSNNESGAFRCRTLKFLMTSGRWLACRKQQYSKMILDKMLVIDFLHFCLNRKLDVI